MSYQLNTTNRRVSRFGRRAFLGGSAAVIGLPWLDSMKTLYAAGAPALPPVRLLYYYIPNGLVMDQYRPATSGAGYAITPILGPLAAFQNDLTVVSGLENFPGWPDDLGHHAAGTASFLTAAHAFKSLTDIRLGISVDQVAAQAFGGATRLPSLELGIDGGSGAGDCDSGYGCPYARNISWANETTPMPKQTSPKAVFDQIFEGYDPDASDAEVARRNARKASVLDLARRDAEDLNLKLAYTDKQKLEQYLTSVRELEAQIDSTAVITCTPGEAPPEGRGLEYPEHMRLMADLMVTAYTCDATRVITFMQGNALSNRTYPDLGITRGHHDISHHGGSQENIDMLVQIDIWEMQQIAYLLDRMKQIPEGPENSSNMLYNSVVFVSSDISDGDRHNQDDKPVFFAGNGGGFLATGQHVEYPGGRGDPKEKLSNLLVTTLAAAGVQTPLGDSDKALLPEVVA